MDQNSQDMMLCREHAQLLHDKLLHQLIKKIALKLNIPEESVCMPAIRATARESPWSTIEGLRQAIQRV